MTCHRELNSPDSYTVGWIAALFIERAAAVAMLEEKHVEPTGFARHPNDKNVYTWGRMGEHNIVIASLAAGVYGTTSAATTASSLLASLPSIRIGLLVGIGGGIARPAENRDIRLGDVVVSQPDGATGGVCQLPRNPPTVLLKALSSIQAYHELDESRVPDLLQKMLENTPKMAKRSKQNPGYIHQGVGNDRLFKASYEHVSGLDCSGCDVAEEVQRDPRDTIDPEIHYGTIASGNTLIKDAATRDRIVADIGEDCICFEMEAAGLMNHFPCLIIRGICDYADSHKNDRWQRYAAATAAAYAREFLTYVPAAEVQEAKKVLDILQSVEQKVDEIQQNTLTTNTITDSIKSDFRADKIHSWLSPPDPSTNANHARKLRHEGTGTWLLESPVFQAWNSGSRRHLWLRGLAGCGKTVLSATVLDYLAKGDDQVILSFFFHFNDTKKQTVDSMLRSFAFQLYQGRVESTVHLNSLFQAHQDGRDQPTTKALWEVICKILTGQKKTSIVIDALDESTTRSELFLWVKDVVSRPEFGHVQLLCTGRPESEFLHDIPPLIGEHSCLELDKKAVNADICSYIIARLEQDPQFIKKKLSKDLVQHLRNKVGDEAEGMFRWAACQLDSLARCPSPKAIKTALEQLPRGLYETYDRMLENIPEDLKSNAIRLLQFLVYTKRPLTLPEAVEIIATEVGEDLPRFDTEGRVFGDAEVLQHCPSLVSIVHVKEYRRKTRKELHLAHFSVREFLACQDKFDRSRVSIVITMTCLTYLTDIKGNNSEIRREYPMARYAAEVWMDHAASSEISDKIVARTAKFLQDETTFQRWCRLYQADMPDKDRPGAPRGSRLYYACLGGLRVTLMEILHKGADVNAQGGEYDNPLQAASYKGYKEIVRLLLDKGADVNTQGGYYGNALQGASVNGHEEIVRLLLDKGADVNAQGGYYDNALQGASLFGYNRIVQYLLGNGANINAWSTSYGSALCTAADSGHEEIVQLLLDKGADVNSQGGRHGNALSAASCQGHQEIVRLLLEKGADINSLGDYGGKALYGASDNGHEEIIQLLLDKGADVNAQSSIYGNALSAASYRSHSEIVRLLLDKGADVNAQGGTMGADINAQSGWHGTAFQAALQGGNQTTVQLLLDNGADVHAQGGFCMNSLQAASCQSYKEIVQLLLDKGADVNAQGGHFGNALSAASYYGQQEIVQLLLDKGADVNAQGGHHGGHYGSGLSAASWKGHLEIVRLLLDKGADVDAQGGRYNPLQAASYTGYKEIVRLLLDKEADVNAQCGKYDNALYAASSEGHEDIVQLLLDKGADVNAQGGHHGNALSAASYRGQQEIVRLLLDKGADVNAQGGFYDNALQGASARGHEEIAQLLLDKGANANIQGGPSGNLFKAALENGHDDTAQLLQQRIPDASSRKRSGSTVLSDRAKKP
ncbi:Pfs NACHT and Ankyrin domain protein, partial [Penicillium canescens]